MFANLYFSRYRKVCFQLSRRFQHAKVSYDQEQTYERAVSFLNKHQLHNAITIEEELKGIGIVAMREFLKRIEITDQDLDDMKVIHVTGTKGKGSTCAFVESILRQHGVRTGFLSSPHLLENRERIRINGKPISRKLFAKYFWEVYTKLKQNNHLYDIDMPPYFYFLTLLSFHTFKHENIDTAIVEVGTGGEYDYTNIVKRPVVCGVSSIGIDHIDRLGDNLASIAWHKSGIFRKHVPAYTAQEQPEEAMKVMQRRADEIVAKLRVVPDFSEYSIDDDADFKLGLHGKFQKSNASLALQLSNYWLNQNRAPFIEYIDTSCKSFHLDSTYREGLGNCRWNGRAQVVKFNSATFYLDGAHTAESIQFAADWFNDESENERKSLGRPCEKVLVFNILSHHRDPQNLLSLLQPCGFGQAAFTPNIIGSIRQKDFLDETISMHFHENPFESVMLGRDAWAALNPNQADDGGRVHCCVADVLSWLGKGREENLYRRATSFTSYRPETEMKFEGKHLQVLVTGSLGLVGVFLRIMCPDINR